MSGKCIVKGMYSNVIGSSVCLNKLKHFKLACACFSSLFTAYWVFYHYVCVFEEWKPAL